MSTLEHEIPSILMEMVYAVVAGVSQERYFVA